MTNERIKGAIVCALVFVLGLVPLASAQTQDIKPDMRFRPAAQTQGAKTQGAKTQGAQTPAGRPEMRFRQVTQMRLNANDTDRRALFAARARPRAMELRKRFAGFGRKRFNFDDIDKSSVPVLVSPREELITSLRVFAKSDRYTASAHKNGSLFEINGTRLPAQAPSEFRLPKSARIVQLEKAQSTGVDGDALQDVRIDHTGSGVDVSFRRFGSVYNVTIDCGETSEADPEAIGPAPGAAPKAASADCTDDNALAVAKEMEVVGGGGAAQ